MNIPCAQCGENIEKNPMWPRDEDAPPWRHKQHQGVGHQGVPNPDYIGSVMRHPSTLASVQAIPQVETSDDLIAALRDRLDTRCIRWPFMLSNVKPDRCGTCTGCVAEVALAKIDEGKYLDEAIAWEKRQVLRMLAENSPHRRVRVDRSEREGEWIEPKKCKRCLFPALPENELCMGHHAVMEGKRRYGTTTSAVKEEHLREQRVVFIGFWRGNPHDIIAEMESSLDTDDPRILNLGYSEVEWDREAGE